MNNAEQRTEYRIKKVYRTDLDAAAGRDHSNVDYEYLGTDDDAAMRAWQERTDPFVINKRSGSMTPNIQLESVVLQTRLVTEFQSLQSVHPRLMEDDGWT